MHVRYKSLNVSLPSSAKQQRQMRLSSNDQVLSRPLNVDLEFNAAIAHLLEYRTDLENR